MRKHFNPFSRQVGGVTTALDAFGFDDSGIRLLPGTVHVLPRKETSHLTNCFVAWVNQTPLIRTGVIDTDRQAHEFLLLADAIYKRRLSFHREQTTLLPLRLSSSQLSSVELEWESVQSQHLALLSQKDKTREQIIHLSTGLEPFYPGRPQKVKTLAEAIEKLPRFLNVEAWTIYFAWYHAHLETALSHFSYDTVETYTLEKSIAALRHEVFSPFLAKAKERLFTLEQQLKTMETEKIEYLIATEKELFATRQDIQRMIKAHYDCLCEIVNSNVAMGKHHPQWMLCQITGKILQKLLENEEKKTLDWAAEQMLFQLLNDELGVMSAVNGTRGLSRTHVAFSIRLAIQQLKQQFPLLDIIHMAMHWDEITGRMNQAFAQQEKDCVERLDESLAVKCREYTLENLLKFCLPIAHLNEGVKAAAAWHENLKENPILLNMLPPCCRKTFKGKDRADRVALVVYHPDSGNPMGLTEAGLQLLDALV